MHKYALNDFLAYYKGSWVLHPTTGKVVRIVGATVNNDVQLGDKSSCRLEDLDWRHVQTPRLGYRGLQEGKLLYYVQRHAGRRASKGVTPAAITVGVPETMATLAKTMGFHDELARNSELCDGIADAIFDPKFVSAEEAIAQLKSQTNAIGFALSHDWAITLGLYQDSPFVLHFKNSRVAGSGDGKKWDWKSDAAKYIYNYRGFK